MKFGVTRLFILLFVISNFVSPLFAAETLSRPEARSSDPRESYSAMTNAGTPSSLTGPYIPPPVKVDNSFENPTTITPVEQSHQQLESSSFAISGHAKTSQEKSEETKNSEKVTQMNKESTTKATAKLQQELAKQQEERKKEISRINDAHIQGFTPLEKQAIQPPHVTAVNNSMMIAKTPDAHPTGIQVREAVQKHDAQVKKQVAWKMKPWQAARSQAVVKEPKL